MEMIFSRDALAPVNFGQIWFQNEKCSVFDEVWHIYQTNHAQFHGDVIFKKLSKKKF